MSPPARVALVGTTGYGQQHRRVIAELQDAGVVELVGLADVREIPDPPPGVPCYADHRDLLSDHARG